MSKDFLKDNKGSFSYFILYIIAAIFLLFLFAVGIPFLIDFNSQIYSASEKLMLDANSTLDNIKNTEIREQLQANLTGSVESIPAQIDILNVFFQYGWMLIVGILALIYFLGARQTIESGGIA